MTRRNKGIETVARVEKARERRAAARMGQQRQSVRSQEERLADLMRYHADYARSMAESLNAGVDSTRLAQYRNFLARLEEAIARQERQVELSRRASADSERTWQHRRTRSSAVDHAVGRVCATQARKEQRIEQSNGDADGLRAWIASRK